jgi:hypothetical protein
MAEVKARQFAMYTFEVMSEVTLDAEQLSAAKDNFMQIFQKALSDDEVTVRVAALKAITAFCNGIDDADVVLGFAPIIPALLKTVVDALKADEDQGRAALESMDDLARTHPEIWKKEVPQLINVVSQIMNEKSFEPGTRTIAAEVILSLSSEMAAPIRKAAETATQYVPALVKMLTEVEEDEATWLAGADEEDIQSTGPASCAKEGIKRLAESLGSKTTLPIVQPMIAECLGSENWV